MECMLMEEKKNTVTNVQRTVDRIKPQLNQ
jgi:hypothetical protein